MLAPLLFSVSSVFNPWLVAFPEPTTNLAKVAADMKPGAWAELKTDGYTQKLIQPVGATHALYYTDKAVWDPGSQQVLFIGQGHLTPPPIFLVYAAKTNAWKTMPTPEWAKPLKFFHAYGNNAIDQGRGIFYHHASATRFVYRYDIAKDAWTTLPEIKNAATGHGTAIEYFPERKGLVRVLGGTVHFYDEAKDEWQVIGEKLAMGPYHQFAVYSLKHKVVFFGGGNGSSDLYKLDADGKIAALKKPAIELGVHSSVLTIDPISGDLLALHKDDQLWSYSPAKDEWTKRAATGMPFSMKGKGHEVVAVPIADHGVVMFFTGPGKGLKVCLYKPGA